MKKLILIFTVLLIISTISLSVFASETEVIKWPPPVYDMPRTVIDTETVSYFSSGLKTSVRSMANIGIKSFGIITVFYSIPIIFRVLFLDKLKIKQASDRREFNRKVNAFDFERNEQSIINDGVLKRRINRKVFAADVERNEDELIDDGVLKRMLNRKIASFDRKFNENSIIEDRVEEMEINHKARSEFRRRHPDIDIEERMYQRQRSYSRRRR